MQSIWQYRKIEDHLREQIRRHGLDKTTGRDLPCERSIGSSYPPTNERREAFPTLPQRVKFIDPKEKGRNGRNEIYNSSIHSASSTSAGSLPPNQIVRTSDDETLLNGRAGDVARFSAFDLNRLQIQHLRSPISQPHPTLYSSSSRLGRVLTGISIRTRPADEQKSLEKGEVFVVGYAGETDVLNPYNWSFLRRISATALVCFMGLLVGFSSSVDSAVIQEAAVEFHVSQVTEALATGIFLVGFGSGSFLAAPLSETVGRNPVYIGTLTLFTTWVMASGLSPNIGAQLVFRFLAGFCGATPLTCVGGTIADMWTPNQRTVIFPIWAHSSFWGSILGPVVGGFIGQAANSKHISWRWTEWVTLI